jgi:hypothetical protein
MSDETSITPPSTEEASSNFYWTCGQKEIFNIQTTVRGAPSTAQIDAHLLSVIEALKLVVARNGHAKLVGNGAQRYAAPQPDALPLPSEPEQPPAEAQKPAQAEAPAPQPVGTAEHYTDVEFVTVSPQPDGNVDVGFWRSGRKYPEERAAKWKPERAATLLAKITTASMSTAAKYEKKCRVFWREGKERQSGGHYHDIERVDPL